ncbi:OmpH family outer membrane protein [Bacteroidales bacterium OttesenSCG-928-A17]|nr:OmpH family outer membrane protein [Bacteroidales bacterium OttesenSCG-928-A17]
MKRANYILKGIAGLAVLVFLISCNKQTDGNTSHVASGDSIPVRLPIAYINTDSLLNNYQFVIDRNEEILKKLEDKRLTINKRTDKFQKEVLEYQQKVQMNAYYSTERRQQEETRLNRQQQEIEQLAAQAEQEIAGEQRNLEQSLQDSLDVAIRDFNKGRYQAIFSNAGASTFFYMDDSYNITGEVIDFLNARYTPKK